MKTRSSVFADLSFFAGLLALFLVLGATVLAALTLAGEFGAVRAPLDIINHFRPLILLAAIAVLVPAALMIRRWACRVAVVLAGLVLIAQGRVVLPEHIRPPVALAATPGPEANTVTFASYNMLKRATSPERLATWVRDEGIDVIVLQEVGLGGRAAVAELAQILPHVHAPEGALALLSRYPLSEPDLVRPLYDKDVRTRPDLIAATVHVPGREPLRVVGVHFGWPQPAGIGQPIQFDWLTQDYLASASARTLLAGDFNSAPGSFAFRRLEAALPLARQTFGLMSFPTQRGVFGLRPPRPFLAIDHIFAGADLAPLQVARGPDLGSDHFPVVARLSLR
ncbi:MAG: endonuclease/exonuclease/phosphatase family protein [Rhizobiales bacterium]|nr:endonuclease/exonuclease/phosphatase family protein [Hyphomicrobiales bacterium]